ncbi:hypothetical protein L6164_021250 [Bauhinia variegata]|uniref:Uncharacterized protein n=1 Tax=Bauhinia variegata TaxID=167791 RepID=A0ACB9MZ74_BAUVA|nr:hypothetical protein L6164_021250 [Bauhinia variegata]
MGRAPCCSKVGLHRGPWTPREDALLTKYIQAHGEGQWRSLPKRAGLLRCGKSCRLRWMNYLRPDIKRGNITAEEDDLIIRMHSLLGNRWSLIAGRLPGRTDNEIKNYWNTHLSKKLRNQGTDPNTHGKLTDPWRDKTTKRKTGNNKNDGSSKKKKKKKQDKNDNESQNAEAEKTVVYLPKPIRVTAFSLPRSNSNLTLDSNSASGSTSQEKDQEEGSAGNINEKEVNNDIAAWGEYGNSEGENDGFGFLHDVRDLVNPCSDMEYQSDFPTLEKLYEEYLQLLNADENQVELQPFAESFFV